MKKIVEPGSRVVSNTKTDEPIVHTLEPMKETKISLNVPIILGAVVVIASGVFTGYVLAKSGGTGGSGAKSITNSGTTANGLKKIVGVQDEKVFKDSVEGVLRDGGLNGEGTHNLERPGGPSQTVYLTSSTVPLDDYKDKKVKIWGETFAAKAAGWFMDVGRLELLD